MKFILIIKFGYLERVWLIETFDGNHKNGGNAIQISLAYHFSLD